MSPPRKGRPQLEEFPPLMTLPQVATYLGVSHSFCLAHLDDRSGSETVLRVAGRDLAVFRHGRGWCAWRCEVGDMVGEKV